jgi:putative endonuclease
MMLPGAQLRSGHGCRSRIGVRAGGREPRRCLDTARRTASDLAVATYYVYILASRPRGTLYVGVTNDLVRRVHEHRQGVADGFTKRYGIERLVYFETTESVDAAIRREKRLKEWQRAWKIALVEDRNPTWIDLYPSLLR